MRVLVPLAVSLLHLLLSPARASSISTQEEEAASAAATEQRPKMFVDYLNGPLKGREKRKKERESTSDVNLRTMPLSPAPGRVRACASSANRVSQCLHVRPGPHLIAPIFQCSLCATEFIVRESAAYDRFI